MPLLKLAHPGIVIHCERRGVQYDSADAACPVHNGLRLGERQLGGARGLRPQLTPVRPGRQCRAESQHAARAGRALTPTPASSVGCMKAMGCKQNAMHNQLSQQVRHCESYTVWSHHSPHSKGASNILTWLYCVHLHFHAASVFQRKCISWVTRRTLWGTGLITAARAGDAALASATGTFGFLPLPILMRSFTGGAGFSSSSCFKENNLLL